MQFLEAVKRFSNERRNRSLAVARDIGGRWAYGTAYGERSRSEAKQTAMENCKKFRKQNAIDAPCKVYMVDRKAVLKEY